MKWTDISSYSQSDGERVPKSFRLMNDTITIIVTRHINYGDEIILRCPSVNIETYPLGTTDMSEAKSAALSIVYDKIVDLQRGFAKLGEQNDSNVQEVPNMQ